MGFRAIIRRWTTRETGALRQLFKGETSRDRFRGLRRSKRNESKLLLLAMLPVLLTAPFLQKWSDETFLGKSVMIVCGIWMVGVLTIVAMILLRAALRSLRERTK